MSDGNSSEEPRVPGSEARSGNDTLVAALACQPDLVVIRIDRSGRILDWPATARRLLGWAPTDMTGQPAALLFAEGDRETFEGLLESGGGPDGEWRATLQTGDKEVVLAGVRLLSYAGGEEAVLIIRDQRGSAASEQWLRWSRGLLSVLGGATIVLDPGGRIREIGTGWLANETDATAWWLGRHAAELFENDRPETISALRQTARQGSWSGQLVLSGVAVDVRFRAIRNDGGRLEAIVGARLVSNPEETRDLFRSLPVGLILLDRDLRVVEVNQELGIVAGQGALPDDPTGIDVRTLGIFQTRPVQTALEALERDQSFELAEVHLKGTSEASLLVDLRGKALTDEGGTVSGYLLTMLSRTGKSNMERQLLQAQKMESIGNFASGLAHDFGNFVSVILGKAGVLRVKLPSDPHITDDLEGIEQAAKRAQHLARDLMRFARGGRGRVTNLDLNQLIHEVSSLIRTSVGKRIEVVTRLDEDVPAIGGDEVELQQMVLNLCLNARDAMVSGGRLVLETRRLSGEALERFEEEGETTGGVNLIVKDTGEGMAPEVAERIFEPFYSTKTDGGKGTGLGLAMVYSIVRRHGGTIEVRSSPGVGTTFEIALPIAEVGPEGEQANRILVVDDEPAFREMIRLILEEDGHDVRLAGSGIEALRTLRREYSDLDLVILDLRMPGIDGLAVLEELRSLAPDLPVLVTTGYASPEEKKSALERGAQQVMEKPYRVAELREALTELLGERSGVGTAGGAIPGEPARSSSAAGGPPETAYGAFSGRGAMGKPPSTVDMNPRLG